VEIGKGQRQSSSKPEPMKTTRKRTQTVGLSGLACGRVAYAVAISPKSIRSSIQIDGHGNVSTGNRRNPSIAT
jgi:hypothetical protein